MEKPNLLAPAYAVPDILTDAQIEALKERGFGVEKAEVKIESFTLDAAVISLKEGWSAAEALDTFSIVFLGSMKDLQTGQCEYGDRLLPFLSWKQGEVVFHNDGPELTKKEQAKEQLAINAYTDILRRFSRYAGGAHLHYHYGDGNTRGPFPDEPGIFRIFGAAGPPGEFEERDTSTIFGEHISEAGVAYRIRGQTHGRGIVLSDDDGPVVQLMGKNFYFLPPLLGHFHEPASTRIFRDLLTLAWNGYRERAKSVEPPFAETDTRAEFVASAESWSLEIRDYWRGQLREYDAEEARILKGLAELRRIRRNMTQTLAVFETFPFAQEIRERLPKDYDAIKNLPDVRRLAVVDHGLHVETHPLVGEHDGRRYLLGSYVIRIGRYGALTVWQEKSVHPEGIPHPHIRKDGAICLGNASDNVAKSASEYRYFDAIAMMLRVLKHGYEPNDLGGVTRIEEWPLAAEQGGEKTAETTDKEARHGTAA